MSDPSARSSIWRTLTVEGRRAARRFREDLNTADFEELQEVPGVGPATAHRIIARRPFASVDELVEIRGINEATLEEMSKFVAVKVVEGDDAEADDAEVMVDGDAGHSGEKAGGG